MELHQEYKKMLPKTPTENYVLNQPRWRKTAQQTKVQLALGLGQNAYAKLKGEACTSKTNYKPVLIGKDHIC